MIMGGTIHLQKSANMLNIQKTFSRVDRLLLVL